MRSKLYLILAMAVASMAVSRDVHVVAADGDATAFVSPGVPHPGSDQIFWVPTFAQAEEVARSTGRMILVMGSVGDWNGY